MNNEPKGRRSFQLTLWRGDEPVVGGLLGEISLRQMKLIVRALRTIDATSAGWSVADANSAEKLTKILEWMVDDE